MPVRSAASYAPSGQLGLQDLQVLQRERACLEKIGDEQARRTAEEIQKVANQAVEELLLIDRRFEKLRVPNSLDPAHCALLLEPVHEGLNGRVRNPFLLGQALENLSHGTGTELPELLQDPCLGFRQAGLAHFSHPTLLYTPYILLQHPVCAKVRSQGCRLHDPRHL